MNKQILIGLSILVIIFAVLYFVIFSKSEKSSDNEGPTYIVGIDNDKVNTSNSVEEVKNYAVDLFAELNGEINTTFNNKLKRETGDPNEQTADKFIKREDFDASVQQIKDDVINKYHKLTTDNDEKYLKSGEAVAIGGFFPTDQKFNPALDINTTIPDTKIYGTGTGFLTSNSNDIWWWNRGAYGHSAPAQAVNGYPLGLSKNGIHQLWRIYDEDHINNLDSMPVEFLEHGQRVPASRALAVKRRNEFQTGTLKI